MRLKIIQPTYYKNGQRDALYKTKKRTLVGLTLPYLASLTPDGWDVELVDEQIHDVDFESPVDVVALTTWTVNSFRAYEIADTFRKRGVPVIMGGPHTFFHSEEAAAHCDAVGIGEGEDIWAQMLEDAANGTLKKIYRSQRQHPLEGLSVPRYDLLNMKEYGGRFRTYSVQSSRGCPFKCEFCSERFYIGDRYRYRPTDEIVEEIKAVGAKSVFFADSMFAGRKQHSFELMEALVPLKIRWSTLWTTYLCKDDKFMDLAKKAGLLHVNMGMESIDSETLQGMNKRFNKVDEYHLILSALRKRGISYSLNFVFGWENEKPEVFENTLKFLHHHKVPVAYFYILSPHRGTPLYDRMKAEGKIIEGANLRRWPGNHCDIRPSYCTPEEMEENVRQMYERFYTMPSMIRRLPMPVTKSHIASWYLNMTQRRMAAIDRTIQNFDWA